MTTAPFNGEPTPGYRGGLPPQPAPMTVTRSELAPDWKWRLKNGGWYLALPVVTAGILAPVPFWHAYSKLGRPQLRARAIRVTVAAIVIMCLFGFAPKDENGQAVGVLGNTLENLGTALALILIVVACVQLTGIRREIFQRPGWHPTRSDPHVTQIQEARTRRQAARELRAKDPAMARELGIGRPDLGRGYDDGGLVDLNTAPAAVIAPMCGLTAAQAEAIVAARTRRGGFYALGEVFIDVALSEAEQSEVVERAIL